MDGITDGSSFAASSAEGESSADGGEQVAAKAPLAAAPLAAAPPLAAVGCDGVAARLLLRPFVLALALARDWRRSRYE